MGSILFANNVNMQLAADLAADDTSFSVIAGQGSQCPEIAADSTDYMLLKIRNKNGLDEIVKIIEHELNSDTFIIGDSTAVPHTPSTDGRAYEKTFGGYQTALAIKASDAHKITMPVTAATLEAALVVYGSGTTTDDFKKLHAITSTHTEINQLHESGVVKADLEKLHDITSSATEINQLHESGVVKADFEKLHAITLSAVEANLLDADNRTIGDILTKTSGSTMGAIAAVAVGNYLKSAGVGAIPQWGKLSLADTGVAVGYRSITTSSQTDIAITTGFRPSAMFFLAPVHAANWSCLSVGFSNGSTHHCVFMVIGENHYEIEADFANCFYIINPAGDGMRHGVVISRSSTGFTVRQSPGGVLLSTNLIYCALP